jgi:hypothetical protein
MPQSTQLSQYPAARAGQIIGDLGKFLTDTGGVAEVALDAGLFACVGTAAAQRKLPTTASEVNATGVGFVMCDTTKGFTGTNDFQIGEPVSLMEMGPGVIVQTQEAMAKGDPVYVVTASTGRGKCRNDADTANATLLPGAIVRRAISSTLALVGRSGYAVTGATGATGATGPTGATGA